MWMAGSLICASWHLTIETNAPESLLWRKVWVSRHRQYHNDENTVSATLPLKPGMLSRKSKFAKDHSALAFDCVVSVFSGMLGREITVSASSTPNGFALGLFRRRLGFEELPGLRGP